MYLTKSGCLMLMTCCYRKHILKIQLYFLIQIFLARNTQAQEVSRYGKESSYELRFPAILYQDPETSRITRIRIMLLQVQKPTLQF